MTAQRLPVPSKQRFSARNEHWTPTAKIIASDSLDARITAGTDFQVIHA